ncbi:MAG TPA: immunoglobulin-like domain-containing protein [Candidatus Paceibacterota bacterium]
MKKLLAFGVLALIVSFGVQANVSDAGGGPEGPYLFIEAAGTGNGQITSSDGFINCFITAGVEAGDCYYDYFPGPFEITLTATASSSSNFVAWNYGECGSNPSCIASSTESGPDVYLTTTFDLNEGKGGSDNTPTITLTGANPQTIIQNSLYTELGATANDEEDGDISASIVITGTSTIDTSVLGDNTVTYSVTDSDENSTSTTRTVTIVAPEAPPAPPSSGGGGGGSNGPIWQTFGVSAPAVLGAFVTINPDGTATEGSSEGNGISGDNTSGGQVLGTTTASTATSTTCVPKFVTFVMQGDTSASSEAIKNIQIFLNEHQNASLTVNGIYDEATISAVKAFQLASAAEILTPWGLIEATGNVYLTTLRAMNIQGCQESGQGTNLPMPELIPFNAG